MTFFLIFAIYKFDLVEEWKKANKIESVGVPSYIASGSHDYKGKSYRFLVIPRFEKDFYKILQERPQKRFSAHSVFAIALQIVSTQLRYLKRRISAIVRYVTLFMNLD
jgi:hypothetical protein